MTIDVFLSYEHTEHTRAQLFASAFLQCGLEIFWDMTSIPAGVPFSTFIEKNILSAKCTVVLWSKKSINSKWVFEEAMFANQLNRYLPVLIDQINPEKDLPFGLKYYHNISISDWNGDSQYLNFRLLLKCIQDKTGKTLLDIPVDNDREINIGHTITSYKTINPTIVNNEPMLQEKSKIIGELNDSISVVNDNHGIIGDLNELIKDTELGSGKVIEFVGEGGMARVYKIWNQTLEVYRAIKILHGEGRKEIYQRFLTEAKITAKLDHPNVITLYNFGEWKEHPYIEMEFIDGKSIEILLKNDKQFPDFVCTAIGVITANALYYAHTLKYSLYNKTYTGIIHRDLKPSNIILTLDGRLKIFDFGIARPISTGFHTMAGAIVGTLPYLSPEQLNDEQSAIDQRTDIYSIGAVLYELLTGQKAFPDERLTELVRKKTSGQYVHIKDLATNSPKELAAIIDKCLSVDLSTRYKDSYSLAIDLAMVHAGLTADTPEIVIKNYFHDINPNTTINLFDYVPSPSIFMNKEVKKRNKFWFFG